LNDKFNSQEKKFANPHERIKTNINKLNEASDDEKSSKENNNAINPLKKKLNLLRLSSFNSNSSLSTMKNKRRISSNSNIASNSTNVSNNIQQSSNKIKEKRTNSMLNFKY
jgi:hypothetical protein